VSLNRIIRVVPLVAVLCLAWPHGTQWTFWDETPTTFGVGRPGVGNLDGRAFVAPCANVRLAEQIERVAWFGCHVTDSRPRSVPWLENELEWRDVDPTAPTSSSARNPSGSDWLGPRSKIGGGTDLQGLRRHEGWYIWSAGAGNGYPRARPESCA
jgi:hypothetical protein